MAGQTFPDPFPSLSTTIFFDFNIFVKTSNSQPPPHTITQAKMAHNQWTLVNPQNYFRCVGWASCSAKFGQVRPRSWKSVSHATPGFHNRARGGGGGRGGPLRKQWRGRNNRFSVQHKAPGQFYPPKNYPKCHFGHHLSKRLSKLPQSLAQKKDEKHQKKNETFGGVPRCPPEVGQVQTPLAGGGSRRGGARF